MPAANVLFHILGQFPYPYSTTGLTTALTMIEYQGDPFLAFLTQTSDEDDIVYLHPETGQVMRSISSGVENSVITGMAFDAMEEGICVSKGQGQSSPQMIRLIDHDANIIREISQPEPNCVGIAVHGSYLAVSAINALADPLQGANTLYLLNKQSGAVIQSSDIPNGNFASGLTEFLGHLIVADSDVHKVFVLHPANGIAAVLENAPGTPNDPNNPLANGIQAIAADNVRNLEHMPQPLECAHGADSQAWQNGLCDPNLAWNPQPWGARNRLYIANVNRSNDLRWVFNTSVKITFNQ